MSVARAKAYRQGLFAETLAAFLFRLKGYKIIAQRYRSPVGEIDLVALKNKRLVFVEVKRRKALDDAAWTVPAKQKRRIVRAAQYWLASHPDYTTYTIAFDVLLAAPWAWPRHIENAFPV
jgi:putative endonuclease